MNKAQLINSIATKTGVSKVEAKNAIDAFVDVTTDVLKRGDRLALIGFGSFSIAERKERVGRNPQTGKEITIPARKVVKFKSGSDLGIQLN
ncbi:MAG: HU family DNA-binding protein [Salinivirgaceae bacterium]|jgi:DNA-binding protein HU-beta|nr:HU family DNA-binding protein [Salinivirgaceae bacterium]